MTKEKKNNDEILGSTETIMKEQEKGKSSKQQQDQQSEKSSEKEIEESSKKQKEEQLEKSSKKPRVHEEETSSKQQKELETEKPSTLLEEIGVTAGSVIGCKAAVAWEARKHMEIESVDVYPPKAMEVRIKVKYTSFSNDDLHFWSRQEDRHLFPRIFGHEAVGIVESVGEGVSDLKVGDHVLSVFTGECGECAHCKSTESNMCDLLKINASRGVMLSDGTSRFSVKGQPLNHFAGISTFSEYTVVHSGCLVKINGEVPMDKVCILSGGILLALAATLKVARGKYDSVAIFGLEVEGLAAAEGARLYGASRIVGVDANCSRELAEKFGVTDLVNPDSYDIPVQEVIKELTNGGVDRSVECTGKIKSIISAFECVHGWGVAVLSSMPRSNKAVFKTNPINFHSRRKLKETFFGNLKPKTELPTFLEHCMKKKLDLGKFITDRFTLSDINEVLKLMTEGKGLRYIINMED